MPPHPHGTSRLRLAAALAAVCTTATLVGCSDSNGGGNSSSSTRPSVTRTSATGPATTPGSASPSSSSAGGRTRITIDNFAFKPAAATVAPGTKITVTNKDTTAHTLTATTGKVFDTGTLGPGKTATFTAPGKAGTYAYTCTIHPFMKGSLTVR